jgi:hypothetical protein
MKTLDNGVVVFDKMTEYENTDVSKMHGVVVCDRHGMFYVMGTPNDLDSKLTVRCESEQDALDIAAMFAERGKAKDCIASGTRFCEVGCVHGKDKGECER